MALIETIPVKEDYRRKLAQQLMREGMSGEPIQHWAQGLAKLGQGALGGYQMYQADQRDKETESGNNAALIAALQGFGGGAPASAQPSPQNPTTSPSAPMTSVNPQAGAIPAALAAQPPKDPTNPNGGMYGGLGWRPLDGDPPPEPPTQTAALSPMVPTPVRTEAIQPTAAPAVPSPTDTQMADAKARIAQMLQSDNPQMRKLGQGMAQSLIAKQLAGKEDPQYEYKERPDGSLIAVDKKNPANFRVVPAPGGGQDAIKYEADKARALQGVNREGTVQYEADKAAAIETAKANAAKAIAKPEQDKQNQLTGTIVTQDIDRAISKIDSGVLPTTGGTGNLLASVPGTQAHDVSKLLDGIKANSGFQELAKMRAASPTGAALGAVTLPELQMLQAAKGSIEQSQTADQLKDNLRRYKNIYLDTIHGEGKGPEREKLTFQEKAAPKVDDGAIAEARRRGLIK
jgi:hypothetical protein